MYQIRHVDLASVRTALAKVRESAKPGVKVPPWFSPCTTTHGLEPANDQLAELIACGPTAHSPSLRWPNTGRSRSHAA